MANPLMQKIRDPLGIEPTIKHGDLIDSKATSMGLEATLASGSCQLSYLVEISAMKTLAAMLNLDI